MTLSALILLAGCTAEPDFEARLEEFSSKVVELQAQLRIPGISMAVVKDGDIVLARGYGYADLENSVPADENTIYHIASLTKPFTAVRLMQMNEAGQVNLDDPAMLFGAELDSTILVRHLLSHSSEEEPGTVFRYNSSRFHQLSAVFDSVSDKSFAAELIDNILDPLGMRFSFPTITDSLAFGQRKTDQEEVSAHLTQPYVLDSLKQPRVAQHESYFGPSAGLMSTVMDLAKFSSALDRDQLMSAESKDRMYTPGTTPKGESRPYALGWFVQQINDQKVIWHYGYWNTNSSLIVKIPGLEMTVIVLANSNMLSAVSAFIGGGDLLESILGREIVCCFLAGEGFESINYDRPFIELYSYFEKKQTSKQSTYYQSDLFMKANMNALMGKGGEADLLFSVYNAVYLEPVPYELLEGEIIAEIDCVMNDHREEVQFTLEDENELRIYAVGEGFVGVDLWDYAWLIHEETRDTLWDMRDAQSMHAGGDDKNRLVDTVITLAEGNYRLGYESDASHAFNRWNARPPTHPFYGVIIVRD